MRLRFLLPSLNLRVETTKKKTNLDYTLSKDVADQQLKFDIDGKGKSNIDIFCNMEYMECIDEEYLYEFKKANYKRVTALFGKHNRGILCYVKK